jgi:hypothetical protein
LVQTDKERKEKIKQHRQTPEYMAKIKARESTSEYKTTKHVTYVTNRLKILLHYSKYISNSNIPCCNCCGENLHVDFLDINHIAGKNQMDSEPKLIKLGYSSKLRGKVLIHWIMENNYPNGFQILCHNCNVAKGLIGNNNTCTHETIRLEQTFDDMTAQSSFEL